MNHVFAALVIEAVGGFAIAGTITAWMRSRLNRTGTAGMPDASAVDETVSEP